MRRVMDARGKFRENKRSVRASAAEGGGGGLRGGLSYILSWIAAQAFKSGPYFRPEKAIFHTLL